VPPHFALLPDKEAKFNQHVNLVDGSTRHELRNDTDLTASSILLEVRKIIEIGTLCQRRSQAVVKGGG